MSFLRRLLDSVGEKFKPGQKWQRLYPVYEALDTFAYSTDAETSGRVHVRDAMDLKRIMITVVLALLPATFFGMYNTGLQTLRAVGDNVEWLSDGSWQGALHVWLGLPVSQDCWWACLLFGLICYLPLWLVTFAVGGFWEVLFACVRKHEINEGFLVTGMIFPLILPPAIPLWQVALAISFGVVIGKEVFGGVGKNIFNPALVGRAFLFFSYPADISGSSVWIAGAGHFDAVSGATALAVAQDGGLPAVQQQFGWSDAFLGFIPGSFGETSTLCCLIGALLLIVTGVASWRTMLGIVLGTTGMALLFNAIGSETNAMFALPFYWHFVIGGWAFGTAFMATDPVSSAFPGRGQFIYGLCIGLLVVAIRVLNPAFPEGMMMAILFMNMFAPLIDHFYISRNIRRREKRMAKIF